MDKLFPPVNPVFMEPEGRPRVSILPTLRGEILGDRLGVKRVYFTAWADVPLEERTNLACQISSCLGILRRLQSTLDRGNDVA